MSFRLGGGRAREREGEGEKRKEEDQAAAKLLPELLLLLELLLELLLLELLLLLLQRQVGRRRHRQPWRRLAIGDENSWFRGMHRHTRPPAAPMARPSLSIRRLLLVRSCCEVYYRLLR